MEMEAAPSLERSGSSEPAAPSLERNGSSSDRVTRNRSSKGDPSPPIHPYARPEPSSPKGSSSIVDGPSRQTGSARKLTVKSKPFWETREKSKSTGLPKASSSEPTREGSAPQAATPSGLTPLLKDQAQIWPSAEDDRVSPLQLPNASPRASPTASPAAAPAQGKHGTTAPVFGAGGRLCRNGPARSASAAGQRGPSG